MAIIFRLPDVLREFLSRRRDAARHLVWLATSDSDLASDQVVVVGENALGVLSLSQGPSNDIMVVDGRPWMRYKPEKSPEEAAATPQPQGLRLSTAVRSVVAAGAGAAVDDLVVVEVPWLSTAHHLPDAIARKKYAT